MDRHVRKSSSASGAGTGFGMASILMWMCALLGVWLCILLYFVHTGYLHAPTQVEQIGARLENAVLAGEQELAYLLGAYIHSDQSAHQITSVQLNKDTGDAHQAAAVHLEQLRGGIEHAGKDIHYSAQADKASGTHPPSESLSATGAGEVHVVFSTDCTPFQDWQTLVLFHSATVVGQKGAITRIASGCDDEKKDTLIKLYDKLWPDRPYRAHFTPDFKHDAKSNKKYDFYNKPWGVKHWLEFADPPVQPEVVVALLDPDMILLRPITVDVSSQENAIWSMKLEKSEMIPRVVEGRPVAQLYGLGAPWTNDKHQKFNRAKICGEGSACLEAKEHWAAEHFSVGPPYLVHKRDMVRICDTWTQFVPKVYEGYPYLLAEMYAYSMAAAHEKLPHLQGEHYMVSNTDVNPGEGWPWVDDLPDGVCELPQGENGLFFPGRKVPTVMHYCQFFRAGDVGFQKRRIPKDIFSCGGDMMLDIPKGLDLTTYQIKDGKKVNYRGNKQAKRNAFALCVIHKAINAAVLDFKSKMCADDPRTKYNRVLNVAGLK